MKQAHSESWIRKIAHGGLILALLLLTVGGKPVETNAWETDTLTFTRSTNGTYNPMAWYDTGATLPDANAGAAVAVINDTIYLFGGGATGTSTIYAAPLSDPTNWQKLSATLPGPKALANFYEIDGMIYLSGGVDGGSQATTSIYTASVADPTNWVDTGQSFPSPTVLNPVAIVGDSIYSFGGAESMGGNPVSSIFAASTSDPTNWSVLSATLPDAIAPHQQFAVIEDSMFIFGGQSAADTSSIYAASTSDPTNWSKLSHTIPGPVMYGSTFIVGDSIYMTAYNESLIFYTASTADPAGSWVDPGINVFSSAVFTAVLTLPDATYFFGGIANVTNLSAAIYRAPLIPNPGTTIFLTSGSSWEVPEDWTPDDNEIHVLGGGAGGITPGSTGGGGGGGGAYSSIANLELTPGAVITYGVGAGGAAGNNGGDSWFNAASYAACSDQTVCARAEGGSAGSANTGGIGGAAADGVGTTKYSGGNGGNGGSTSADSGGGGGGAAGPHGNGANGGNGNTNSAGAGGGGADGGYPGGNSGSSAGAGGNGRHNTGGGVAVGATPGHGTNGGGGGGSQLLAVAGDGGFESLWIQSSGLSAAGPGGGGGSGNTFATRSMGGSGVQGAYGGGGGGASDVAFGSQDPGGAGQPGIIVITYGANTTPPRKIRLFEGYAVRLTEGTTLKLYGE